LSPTVKPLWTHLELKNILTTNHGYCFCLLYFTCLLFGFNRSFKFSLWASLDSCILDLSLFECCRLRQCSQLCDSFQVCSWWCDSFQVCSWWYDSFQVCSWWCDSFVSIYSSAVNVSNYVLITVTVSDYVFQLCFDGMTVSSCVLHDMTVSNSFFPAIFHWCDSFQPMFSSYVFIDVTVSNSCFPAMFLLMWQFPHMSNLCDSFQIGSSKHDNLQLWFPGFKFMWQFSQQSLVVYDTKISNVVSCVWGFHCTRGFDILNITKGNFYIDIIQPTAFYY